MTNRINQIRSRPLIRRWESWPHPGSASIPCGELRLEKPAISGFEKASKLKAGPCEPLFSSPLQGDTALKSRKISAFKSPANVKRVGHRGPPLFDPPRAPAAGLVRSHAAHTGLNYITYEIYDVEVDTNARRNFTPRFFHNLWYSWQISRPVKLPALALVARNFFIILLFSGDCQANTITVHIFNLLNMNVYSLFLSLSVPKIYSQI